jgi:hypothetical protein
MPDYLDVYWTEDFETFRRGGDSILARVIERVGGPGAARRAVDELTRIGRDFEAKGVLRPKGAA